MFPNLFSIFDPSTSNIFSLNWLSFTLCLFITPMIYWMKFSRLMVVIFEGLMMFFKEFKMMLIKFNVSNLFLMISLMYMIIINNIFGLFPYIFTSTSHLILTVSLALPLWLSLMIFGWINNYYLMLFHLVPVGTPNMLMPFMVLIETISNIIRPLTLSVRLMANMIAGHLLITLLSSMGPMLNYLLILMLFMQFMLFMLEFGVSFIQGYVFTILSVMYMKEVN
uniref:ATP synthase subunit a n=1 Tax=Taeniogonalos taihorina TaxID=1515605 RepID=A0A0K0KBJ2_9HYME|nr:ATP synthase F0 subunit 6 [Taeniogonalos taihorina]AIE11787.1 ATP synthase FO subunit 6 [Taeniogonalos taihorina]